MVWLTDNELRLLLEWHRYTFGHRDEDARLREKLLAYREEVACRTLPGNGRVG